MDFLLPTYLFMWMATIHTVLFILSVIWVIRSLYSHFTKIILVITSFFLPIIGSIVAFTFIILGKKALV